MNCPDITLVISLCGQALQQKFYHQTIRNLNFWRVFHSTVGLVKSGHDQQGDWYIQHNVQYPLPSSNTVFLGTQKSPPHLNDKKWSIMIMATHNPSSRTWICSAISARSRHLMDNHRNISRNSPHLVQPINTHTTLWIIMTAFSNHSALINTRTISIVLISIWKLNWTIFKNHTIPWVVCVHRTSTRHS